MTSTWGQAGGGTWRVTLHRRAFTPGVTWSSSLITELPNARSRRLDQQLNKSATFTWTLDGHAPEAALVEELRTEVIVWRGSVPYFRGIVAQSQDTLSEQTHSVTFTAHDLFAMVQRRYLTKPIVAGDPGVAQDVLVNVLLDAAIHVRPSSGVPADFLPGSFLPLEIAPVGRAGEARAMGGPPRVRTYEGQSSVGKLIEDLSGVIDGFDFDVAPAGADMGNADDHLRVFYPSQGVDRTEPLEWGGAVATVSRSVNSADYGNWWRVIGNSGSSDPATPQLAAEIWNPDAQDVGRGVGVWQDVESASDVSDPGTLSQHAAGALNRSGLLVPSYTLGLRPGAYAHGALNMGDTIPLVIRSGRLNVSPDYGGTVRIVGRTFDIGDDGQEDVALTVGRPLSSLVDLLSATADDVNALARR